MHGTSLYIATYVGLVFSYSTRYPFHDFITMHHASNIISAPPLYEGIFQNMDDRPKLAELQEWIRSFRTLKWMNLGIQLGLEDNALEAIKIECINKVDECRTAMFREWLRTI